MAHLHLKRYINKQTADFELVRIPGNYINIKCAPKNAMFSVELWHLVLLVPIPLKMRKLDRKNQFVQGSVQENT